MPVCKKCGSNQCVKNGKIREKQRYRCKSCRSNFVEGDSRTSQETAIKKMLFHAITLFGSIPLHDMASALHVWPSQLCRWKKAREKSNSAAAASIRSVQAEQAKSMLADLLPLNKKQKIILASGSLWKNSTAVILLYESGEEA